MEGLSFYLSTKNNSSLVKSSPSTEKNNQENLTVSILRTGRMNEGILRIRKEIPRSFLEKHIIWKWNLLKYERVVDTNVCKVHIHSF